MLELTFLSCSWPGVVFLLMVCFEPAAYCPTADPFQRCRPGTIQHILQKLSSPFVHVQLHAFGILSVLVLFITPPINSFTNQYWQICPCVPPLWLSGQPGPFHRSRKAMDDRKVFIVSANRYTVRPTFGTMVGGLGQAFQASPGRC